MNWLARAKRRQSPTSAASVSAEPGHPTVGGQPGDLGGERWPVVPAGKVGLDRVQLRVAALQRRTVVRVGGLQRRFVELLAAQPRS
jgi:hypothetical protein